MMEVGCLVASQPYAADSEVDTPPASRRFDMETRQGAHSSSSDPNRAILNVMFVS